MRRKLIAGNWKMNGLRADGVTLAVALAERMRGAGPRDWDMLICPPATLLFPVAEAISDSPIALGGQDCHSAASGAHTGDVSAAMLKDAGCTYVIVGHSERRADHGEGNVLVRRKAEAALAVGLAPLVCVGETEREREAGETLAVIQRQIEDSLPWQADPAAFVVAYEPVWAIGTGRTATSVDIAEVHAHIRALLTQRLSEDGAGRVRVLYGGSVKPGNAAEILAVANVDGALVGGASLKPDDFWAVATAGA
jgi:triosephosphate isomerase